MHNVEILNTRVINRRHSEKEDIYIGRGSYLGLGNPFTHLPLGATQAKFQVQTRQESIQKFEDWVFDQPKILAQIWKMQGKKLGCYCHPLPCHGQVYVYLVATYVWMRDVLGIEPNWETPEGRAQIKTNYYEMKDHLDSRLTTAEGVKCLTQV